MFFISSSEGSFEGLPRRLYLHNKITFGNSAVLLLTFQYSVPFSFQRITSYCLSFGLIHSPLKIIYCSFRVAHSPPLSSPLWKRIVTPQPFGPSLSLIFCMTPVLMPVILSVVSLSTLNLQRERENSSHPYNTKKNLNKQVLLISLAFIPIRPYSFIL